MMALLGFAILFGVGLIVLIAGLSLVYASLLIATTGKSWPLLIIPAWGAAMLYVACKYAPFAIQWSAK